jgi:hypothetical protein
MKKFWTLLFLPLASAACLAQGQVSIPDGGPVPGPVMSTGMFAYKEVMRRGEFVKGSPYTANATTETTQVLADGNRIVNKSSASLARDSEGRTRREETLSNAGPLPLSPMKMVFIDDPTTGSSYVLNMTEKTADVMKPGTGKVMAGTVSLRTADGGAQVMGAGTGPMLESRVAGGPGLPVETRAAGVRIDHAAQELGDIHQQSLGTEVVEGLNCDHMLTTQTIPAGAIGNEQPIVITSETWASPDLHLLIIRKHSDPRFGETVYKLSNITRNEPDPSLFQPPSDFRVMDKLPPLRSPLQ